MQTLNITVGLAFLAGLASFLSPCVLSLVPVYIGYLSGRAVGGESVSRNRWITFSHGVAFVIGFSVVFIFFNIIAATLGGLNPIGVSAAKTSMNTDPRIGLIWEPRE